MDRVCLLVDIDLQGLDQTWADQAEGHSYPLTLSYVTMDEVRPMFETGSVGAMIIFAEKSHADVMSCLELFKKYVGPLAEFQAIVSSDPDPEFMSEVFEYGIEKFILPENWAQEVETLCEHVAARLSDRDGIESKAIKLNHSIVYGDQSQINQSQTDLGDAHSWDYVAAYVKANALQAVGKFNEAAEAFRSSQNMNKMFRQASSGLGESLLVLGKVDEAIEILERLEKQNPRHVERKAHLATAYMEKGDKAKVEALLAEAEAIDPNHPRLLEARAEILLVEGKVGEAFKMMDSLHDVGPFFAAKLNEMGIKLSQQGKGKSAMALYKKAHKIVRHELQYKISLNAALACYRMGEYQIALQYLSRTEKEFGGRYEKVDKIRGAIKKILNKGTAKQVG
jgi:tetratricopeptide (TPR) repeat protein